MEEKEINVSPEKSAEEKPNLLFAILAAIGLGLVGCAIYGILYYVGYIDWIASYVTVVAAAWGYKHFNKKMDWKGYLTVTIVSVVGLLITMFMALIIYVANEFNTTFSIASKTLFDLLDTHTKIRNGVIQDGILTAVFTLLGLLSYFFYEFRLKKSKERNVEQTASANVDTVEEKTEETTVEENKTAEPEKVEKKESAEQTPANSTTTRKPTQKKTESQKSSDTPLVIKPVVSSKPKAKKSTDKKGE